MNRILILLAGLFFTVSKGHGEVGSGGVEFNWAGQKHYMDLTCLLIQGHCALALSEDGAYGIGHGGWPELEETKARAITE